MQQPVLTTPNLTLRPVQASDQQIIFEGFSHPQIIQYLEINYPTFEATVEQMQWYKQNLENETGYAWLVLNALNQPTGVVSIYNLHKAYKKAEIGYWFFPQFWGKGIAKEGLKAMLQFMDTTLKLHRIAAEVEPENKASVKLLQALGFKQEGVLVDFEYRNNTYNNLEIWAKIFNHN